MRTNLVRWGTGLSVTGALALTMAACGVDPAALEGAEAAAQADSAPDPLRCVAGQHDVVAAPDGRGGVVTVTGSSVRYDGHFTVARLDGECRAIWHHRIKDGLVRHPAALAVDGCGDVIVGGTALSLERPLVRGRTDRNELLLMKLSLDGRMLWSREIPGLGRLELLAVAPSGNVAAIGWFDHLVDFGGGPLRDAGASVTGFVTVFDGNGGHLWDRSLSSRHDVRVAGAAFDADDALVLGGRLARSADLGGGPLTVSPSDPGPTRPMPDAFLVKYDAKGRFLWDRSYGNGKWQSVTRVSIDADENITAAIDSRGVVDLHDGAAPRRGSFVLRLDPHGNELPDQP